MTATSKNYFRPNLESLESRDMLDTGFVNAVTSLLPPAVYRDLLQNSNVLLPASEYQAASTAAVALTGSELLFLTHPDSNTANAISPPTISGLAIPANEALLGIYEARWEALDAEAREALFA